MKSAIFYTAKTGIEQSCFTGTVIKISASGMFLPLIYTNSYITWQMLSTSFISRTVQLR